MKPSLIVNHRFGSYPIYIRTGLQECCTDILGKFLAPSGKHALITDSHVNRLYAAAFIQTANFDLQLQVCPAGEASKSFAQYENLLNSILRSGLDRQSTIIALGGGVPGDLAGFVAATFMRGIPLIQIPTTLLAQVDSSVGGKTGINLAESKNSVGAFWQPQAVLIDPSVLLTLEREQLTSGLAEVVKYGVIMDADFFAWLESNVDAINELDMEIMTQLIHRCCVLKAQVVEEDERETRGRRAILNYGHTFAHAIEKVFGYGVFPHGHAVAMGMHAAAILATKLNLADQSLVIQQAKLLKSLRIPHQFPHEHHDELWNAMQKDKKTVAGELHFILPTRIGHVDLVSSVGRAKVLESMDLAGHTME